MKDEKLWRAAFSGATAVLMLGILLMRSNQPPIWALVLFPAIGSLLALIASRTAPNPKQIAWLETSTIAAACVFVLVFLINGIVLETFVSAFATGERFAERLEGVGVILLVMASVALWFVLERGLKRIREGDHSLDVDAKAVESDKEVLSR